MGRSPRRVGRAAQHAARPARCRVARRVRQRRADQREGLPARQVRARRAAHAEHRLQRPLLHVLGGRRRQPLLRDRPGPAVPGVRHRTRRRGGAVGLQLRRHHAPDPPVVRRAAGSWREADRRRSAAIGNRRRGRPAPPARAGVGSRAGERDAPHRRRRGPRRRALHRRAHHRLRRRPAPGPGLRLRPGRAPHGRPARAGPRRGAPPR